MKKLFMFGVLIAMVVLFVGAVSAKTLITGKIYNADYTETISNANVEVTCNGNVKNTSSLDDGSYSVTYSENGAESCNNDDILSVFASHPDYGANMRDGVIHDNAFDKWDLAVVNVPLVPEFGFFVGGLTILGAVGIFFFISRK